MRSLLRIAAFMILVVAGPVRAAGPPPDPVTGLPAIGPGDDIVFRWLYKFFGLHGTQSAIAVAVLALGGAAYWFKRWNVYWYGVTEVTFGVGSAISISSGMNLNGILFDRWAALAGAAYVIARGLNNISEGRKSADARRVPNEPK